MLYIFLFQKYYCTMLKYITVAFALILAMLDFFAYRRLLKYKVRKSISRTFATVVITANIIPLSVPLFMFIFNNENNGTLMMKISMVLLTVFVALTLCRLILYIFWLPSRKKIWLYWGGVVSFIAFIMLTYGIFVTRTSYRINEVELSFENLPSSFNGYRIAFISDIHVGSMYNPEHELERLAEKIYDTEADILLFGGDLVNLHHSELTKPVLEKLSFMKGKEGTLAVLGNHDTGAYLKDSVITPRNINKKLVEEKLNTIGWTVLRDSTLFLYRDNDSIAITGIDYTDELLKFKHNMKKGFYLL